MRLVVLLIALLPAFSRAQPVPDREGVAEAFGRFLSIAQSDHKSVTAELIACPVDAGDDRPVAGYCDMELAAHRVRVENITTLATLLFPSEPTALDPHYAVEEERDGVFHLLLFSSISSADYVLAAFTDVGGAYLLTNLDSEGGRVTLPPPTSVVDALHQLLASAADGDASVDSFAPLVVARGDDIEREWKVSADPSREDERHFVGRARQSIRTLMEGSRGDFEILGYESEEESEGEWHVLQVRFDTHEMEEYVTFAFLPIGPSFLLGDIDS